MKLLTASSYKTASPRAGRLLLPAEGLVVPQRQLELAQGDFRLQRVQPGLVGRRELLVAGLGRRLPDVQHPELVGHGLQLGLQLGGRQPPPPVPPAGMSARNSFVLRVMGELNTWSSILARSGSSSGTGTTSGPAST